MPSSRFSNAMAAVEHGAALVYHDVLAAVPVVQQWAADHPECRPLIETGLAAAQAILVRFGIPPGTVEIVALDIVAALKLLAALDPTVRSG